MAKNSATPPPPHFILSPRMEGEKREEERRGAAPAPIENEGVGVVGLPPLPPALVPISKSPGIAKQTHQNDRFEKQQK